MRRGGSRGKHRRRCSANCRHLGKNASPLHIMENCCYGHNELLVLHMVRAGMFGQLCTERAPTITICVGSCLKIAAKACGGAIRTPNATGISIPRMASARSQLYGHQSRRSLRLIVSMSSPQEAWRHIAPPPFPRQSQVERKIHLWRMNTSLIKTVKGSTIMVQHDVSNPQPYDRINLIKGVKGMFRDYPSAFISKAKKARKHSPVRLLQR